MQISVLQSVIATVVSFSAKNNCEAAVKTFRNGLFLRKIEKGVLKKPFGRCAINVPVVAFINWLICGLFNHCVFIFPYTNTFKLGNFDYHYCFWVLSTDAEIKVN